MGVKVGEIEYDEAAELKRVPPILQRRALSGRAFVNRPKTRKRSTIRGKTENQRRTMEFDPVELEKSQLEARIMAGKIKELIAAGTQVYNPKTKSIPDRLCTGIWLFSFVR